MASKLNLPTKNWWETEKYTREGLLPGFDSPDIFGPNGPAFVKVHADGTTQKGWGLVPPKGSDEGFMPRYMGNEFLTRKTEYGYDRGKHGAALVMRSTRLVCIDIDGKNGGQAHAGSLGSLPLTMAETSKSGNGHHLFYTVPNDVWDEEEGFAWIPDQIGIVQGVDIRGVGCVYHWPVQRWNNRQPVDIPDWLETRLRLKLEQRDYQIGRIQKTLTTMDEDEVLMMQGELLQELAKKIPAGRRNVTLYAIGCQLKAANVPDWEDAISDRGMAVGLSSLEVDKIVANIDRS